MQYLRKNNGITLIAIVIIILQFLIIGGLIYYIYNNRNVNNIEQNEIININKELGETDVKATIIENVVQSNELTQTYSNKGITVKFPDDWKVATDKEDVAIFLFGEVNAQDCMEYIVIETPKKLDKDYTLEEYATVIKNKLEYDSNIYSEGEKIIGNIKGYEILYGVPTLEKITHFYTIKNGTLYSFLLCAREDYYSKTISTMEQIVASVEIAVPLF